MPRFPALGLGILLPLAVHAAEVPFGARTVVSAISDGAIFAVPADLDGDGDLDLVAVSRLDDTLAWYRNSDGAGAFVLTQVIAPTAANPQSVTPVDLDRDGDLDLVVASFTGDTLAWYENTTGNGSFGAAQTVATADGPLTVVAADVDRDGDPDLVLASSNDDTIAWYENLDGAAGSFAAHTITTSADGVRDVLAADVDGDGDLDAIGASQFDDSVAWHENVDGSGTSWVEHVVTATLDGVRTVAAGDLDGDGDLDLVSGALHANTVTWHENTDGSGTFAAPQTVGSGVEGPNRVGVADVDGDGDRDVLVASSDDHTLAWFENSAADASAWTERELTSAALSARSLALADLDGDGDLDAVASSHDDDTVGWLENETIHRSAELLGGAILPFEFPGVHSPAIADVIAADVDGDGDPEVILARDARIAWFETDPGAGPAGGSIYDGFCFDLFAADLDGELGPDLLALCENAETLSLVWFRNQGGGVFSSAILLEADAELSVTLGAADLDGDGDLDVIFGSVRDELVWFENADGRGAFGSAQSVASGGRIGLFPKDLDGDGDVDLVSSSRGFEGFISWHENVGGAGTFAEHVLAEMSSPLSVFSLDFDGDGDADVLYANGALDQVGWLANDGGAASFTERSSCAQLDVFGVFGVDVDGDGDADLISSGLGVAGGLTDPASVSWCENVDGLGTLGPARPITTAQVELPRGHFSDLDGDGDPDLLYVVRTAARWAENDGTGRFVAPELPNDDLWGGLRDLAPLHVNRDGRIDVITAGNAINDVHWSSNAGDPADGVRFDLATSIPTSARRVRPVDLDRDGDADVLITTDPSVSWLENKDGAGAFAASVDIASGDTFRDALAGDVDGDGDLDVVTASATGGIGWYANDGAGGFGAAQPIASTLGDPTRLAHGDLDADGRLDVVAAGSADDRIEWLRNAGGGAFVAGGLVSSALLGPSALVVADLDADGAPDVLATSEAGDRLAWFRNGGAGGFGPIQTIDPMLDGAMSPFAIDVDRDGELDVFAVARQGGAVVWYESDGLGGFAAPRRIATVSDPSVVTLSDFDGDGAPDALLSVGDYDFPAALPNRGGQYRLDVSTLAPPHAFEGDNAALLEIQVTHLGRPGDAALLVTDFALRFEREADGPEHSRDPLSNAQANAILDELVLYRDDGSGVFEDASDTPLIVVPGLTLAQGVQTLSLPTGADAQVAPGTPARFFVVARFQPTAGSASVRALQVRHLRAVAGVEHVSRGISLERGSGADRPTGTLLVFDPAGDDDGDGLDNADELLVHGTDPRRADSDRDGVGDGDEVGLHGTDPLDADSDDDGLLDGEEVNVHGTDPLVADTDGDGLSDGDEVKTQGTNPQLDDTDGDGLSDGDEVQLYGTDPLVDDDADGDSLSDADEIARGLNPHAGDTDGDGFADDVDNCPSAYNPDQRDRGGIGGATPDGVGDLCQNGDFDGDGDTDILDVTLQRRGLAGLEPTLDPALPPGAP